MHRLPENIFPMILEHDQSIISAIKLCVLFPYLKNCVVITQIQQKQTLLDTCSGWFHTRMHRRQESMFLPSLT